MEKAVPQNEINQFAAFLRLSGYEFTLEQLAVILWAFQAWQQCQPASVGHSVMGV